MRLHLEFAGYVLTIGPTDDDDAETSDDDEPERPGVVSVDLTHQGGPGIGFTAEIGSPQPLYDD